MYKKVKRLFISLIVALTMFVSACQPTPTSTPTSIPTPIPTFTAISTSTPIPTPTFTPAPTKTSTATYTKTSTLTSTPLPTSTLTPISTNSVTPTIPLGPPTIEFIYVPPKRQDEITGPPAILKGRVKNVAPENYKVAVYIYVETKWWTKPYLATPLTSIMADGQWETNIVTGGHDGAATAIIAFLVPSGYDPKPINGGASLPTDLSKYASVIVYR